MKRHFLQLAGALLTAGVAISCSNKQQTFTIDGTVSEDITDTAYYVYISDASLNFSQVPVDTIIVKDKKFSYTSNIGEPRLINLQAVFKDGTVCNAVVDFFLMPGETAQLKVCNGFYELTGSKFYKEWNDFETFYKNIRKELSTMVAEINTLDRSDTALFNQKVKEYNEKSDSITGYVKEHNSEEGVVVLACAFMGAPTSLLLDSTNLELRNGRLKTFLDTLCVREQRAIEAQKKIEEKYAAAMAETAEGMMFKDFEAEYDGKVQKLSDFVGKGKYVLVDFWASWCGPCRQEIPNLIKVWEKYSGKNFEVLGVASWDEPGDTKKAIDELGIKYPQIMNAQNAGTDVYGIGGIPQIILFGPDGTILHRDLRGNAVEEAVAKYLK